MRRAPGLLFSVALLAFGVSLSAQQQTAPHRARTPIVTRPVGVVGQTLKNATAQSGLLSQTVNTRDDKVQHILSPKGQIVERTLNKANKILDLKVLGSVTTLAVVKETPGQDGAVVRQVRDQAGNLIQYTLGQDGTVSAVRVLKKKSGGRAVR